MRARVGSSSSVWGEGWVRRLIHPPPACHAPVDADVRAVCERRALRFGRRLLTVGAAEVADVVQLTDLAEAARQDGQQPCYPL